jgi:hypothetical protein
MEWALAKAWMKELFNARLVKFSKGNGDYRLINK